MNKPENGQRPDSCENGNELPDGAKCELTCDEGFKVQGQQPSCTLTTFRVGNITCNDDDFPWWVEIVGGAVSLVLIFGMCHCLDILPFSASTWAPAKKTGSVRPSANA